MKIENQVVTIEQAKKLKELGVTAEPLFWYVIDIDPITPLDIIQKWQHSNFDQCEKYPAYTVAELGVMLPHFDNLSQMGGFVHLTEFDPSVQDGNPWYCVWEYDKDKENAGFGSEIIDGETEAQARAAMLIYLLENNLTTAEEVNQRLNS